MSERSELWLIAGIAICLRLVYVSQYVSELPFIYGPIADSVIYLEQAAQVRRGQFGAAALLAFSPLYGYVLAASAGPERLIVPILLQLGLGCATAVLLYRAVLRFADRNAARFATGLYLGYGTLLYYESKILSETLGLWLTMLALSLYTGAATRAGKWGSAFASGAVLGLAILARASLVFIAPLAVLAAILRWAERETLQLRAARSTAVALGLASVLGANGLWTWSHSGLFVPVILVSRTIEASSGHAYDGTLTSQKHGAGVATSGDVVASAQQRLDAVREGRPEPSSSVSRIDFAGWLHNLPEKTLQTFSPAEITFQYGFNGERSYVPILRALPVGFALILLWGCGGAIVLARTRGLRSLLPFAPFVIGVLITTTLYHPSTRYRLAIILPLLMCSGSAFSAVLHGRRRYAGLLALASCGLIALHLTQIRYNQPEYNLQLAFSASAGGDSKSAIAYARTALALSPHSRSVRDRARVLLQAEQAKLANRQR